MGIKEAIYLLEREGLRVAFSGTGCVRSQSIPAGAPAQRGELVVLQRRGPGGPGAPPGREIRCVRRA
ncbi:MAG: PASTA domain-containing protein [Alistipes indistinctus]